MQNRTLLITRLAALLGLTLAFQAIGLPQMATGPVINALLFLSCALFGPWTALILGALTPFAALIRGQLAAPLWPLIPLIIAGNWILILSYHSIRKAMRAGSQIQYWIATLLSIALPSVLKFSALAAGIKIGMPWLLGRALPPGLAAAFAAPQFFTALAGGALATAVLKVIGTRPEWDAEK